jgi:DNA polymerase (family 10)
VHDDYDPQPSSPRPDRWLPDLPEAEFFPVSQRGRYTLDEVTDFSLVRPCDIRGVLHSHSRYGDGAHSLDAMVETAREIGLEYLGISDHYQSRHHEDGLDIETIAHQRQEIEALNLRHPEFDILQGVELDANADGSLPLEDSDLLLFDYVIVSLPECHHCSENEWTDRVLRVLENPLVTILGKPVGEFMLRPGPIPMDMKEVLKSAAGTYTAVEIDANPNCAEVQWDHCHTAQEMGTFLAINPNAHRAARLVDFRHGAEMAREAGICCRSILNTLTARELRRFMQRGR